VIEVDRNLALALSGQKGKRKHPRQFEKGVSRLLLPSHNMPYRKLKEL
jgi:hypothetical protein